MKNNKTQPETGKALQKVGRASKGLERGSQCGGRGAPASSLKKREESIAWRPRLQNDTGPMCLPGEHGMERVDQGPREDPGKGVLWSDEQTGEWTWGWVGQ